MEGGRFLMSEVPMYEGPRTGVAAQSCVFQLYIFSEVIVSVFCPGACMGSTHTVEFARSVRSDFLTSHDQT
jgi:hypothetical protein